MIEKYLKSEKPQLEIVRLMPTLCVGPSLLSSATSSIEAFAKILNGEYPGIPKLMFPHVDVRDVALAHLNALTYPNVNGKRFLITQQSFWMKETCEFL